MRIAESVAYPNTLLIVELPEDQQRINAFSKLNARYRSIEDKINALKVCPSDYSQQPLLTKVWIRVSAGEGGIGRSLNRIGAFRRG